MLKRKENTHSKKYLLVLRNEDNLQETFHLRFTVMQLATILLLITCLVSGIGFAFSSFLMSYWKENTSPVVGMNKKIVKLLYLTDSLSREVEKGTLYARSLKAVFSQDTTFLKAHRVYDAKTLSASLDATQSDTADDAILSSLLSETFYAQTPPLAAYKRSLLPTQASDAHFFSPIQGYVSSNFSLPKEHYGVDIVAGEGEPVRTIAGGTVFFASWTQDGGYVIGIQHQSHFLSIYKHNSKLLKEMGDFVAVGEPIAIIGNTGDLTSGPHLHFELWYKGIPLDPKDFTIFN